MRLAIGAARRTPLGVHAAAYFQSAHLRKHQVQHHEVRLAPAKDLQGFLAVGGGDDRVSVAAQIQTDNLPDIRLVIHDQYLRHRSARPFAPGGDYNPVR